MKHIITFIVVLGLLQTSFAQRILRIESGYSRLNSKNLPHITGNEGYNIGTTIEIPIYDKRFGLDVGLNFRHINQKLVYVDSGRCTVGVTDRDFTDSYLNVYTLRTGYYCLLVNQSRWSWKIASGMNTSKSIRANITEIFSTDSRSIKSKHGFYLSNTIQYRLYHNMYGIMSQSIDWEDYKFNSHLLNVNAGLGYKF